MLAAEDIQRGRIYRARRPKQRFTLALGDHYNDREVIWVSQGRTQVQYDGPAVRLGSRYPMVSMEKFLQWAGKDITADEHERPGSYFYHRD